MHVRVERPVGGDLLDPLGGEHGGEGILRHPDALEHLDVLVVLGGVERPLEVVEHGDQLRDDALPRAREDLRLLACDALAVVVEVRRDATEVVHRLLVPTLGVLETREQLLGVELRCGGRRVRHAVRRGLGALVGHDVFAASSSSITS